MSFVSAQGIACPNSFWTSEKYEIHIRKKRGIFKFIGFATMQAALEGKEPFEERIEAQCSGERFDFYMARHLTEGIPINQLAYELADELGLFPGAAEVNS